MALSNGRSTVYEFDEFRVDPHRQALLRGDEPVPLTPKVFEMLTAFLERPGELLPKEELMERLQPGLRAVFRTSRPVYIGTNSATGFMEAALRNGARRRVLSLVNGLRSQSASSFITSAGRCRNSRKSEYAPSRNWSVTPCLNAASKSPISFASSLARLIRAGMRLKLSVPVR